jgi:pimeloyl-ACP methyl ester carboxylesterase
MHDLGHGGALSSQDFSTIKNDVLILRGFEDKLVSAESSKEVANWLKNGTYKEMDGAPHPLEKVDEDVLVREIVGFCGIIPNLRNLYFFTHIPQIKLAN